MKEATEAEPRAGSQVEARGTSHSERPGVLGAPA